MNSSDFIWNNCGIANSINLSVRLVPLSKSWPNRMANWQLIDFQGSGVNPECTMVAFYRESLLERPAGGRPIKKAGFVLVFILL